MLKNIFTKKRKYATIPSEQAKRDIPEGILSKCKKCGTMTYVKELEKNAKVCPKCGYHYPLTAQERLRYILDDGRFFEYDTDLRSVDPLDFPDYERKVAGDMQKTNLSEAVVTGEGTIGGFPVAIGVMDWRFRMGSMGSVVGEKITRTIERAGEKQYPLILFSASGGARMQEGILSLMQMAKTSAALERFSRTGGLYISVLTDPTTGGVSASFATLGDINLAEPGALIGFTGPRVIEQTIRQKLPEDFQTAEFLLAHGQLDLVAHRHQLRETLAQLLDLHLTKGAEAWPAH